MRRELRSLCRWRIGGPALSYQIGTFSRALALVGLCLWTAGSVSADSKKLPDLVGPDLASASNFGHGWKRDLFNDAGNLGITDFRDIIYWSLVEQEPGQLVFADPRTNYPARLKEIDARMSLTLNWGNDFYDDGHTPHSQEALEALGRFVVAALDAYPRITAVEVGNEFNGSNFVTGPVLDAKREKRAAAHFELLRAVSNAVNATHPEVRVLGGAAHSVPGGYLWPIIDLGGAEYMDAFVLHPYTTPPEQLARQIDVLRRHEGIAELPVQVTEFGTKNRLAAPGFLLRMYCAMSLSGVERAAWYPLNDRGDELIPLIDPITGQPTSVGKAYERVQSTLVGLPVQNVSPDPYTYGCKFGDNFMVIWGEPRQLTVANGIEVRNPQGVRLDPAVLRLSIANPLFLASDQPLEFGKNVKLSENKILADSFHQFAYPTEGERVSPSDGFVRFAQRGERPVRLYTMPGQEAQGTPWTPYLGNKYIRPVRVTADTLVPGRNGDETIAVVHRYLAEQSQNVAIEATWTPSDKSSDGIDIEVTLDGVLLHGASKVKEEHRLSLPEIELQEGQTLEFIVGPGEETVGDITDYRITLRKVD
ncbi:MAG: hypothetical protein AAGF74_00840 [Pseudomonadota bacterium]